MHAGLLDPGCLAGLAAPHAVSRILGYHQQAALRVAGKLLSAPQCTRAQFGLCIGGFVEENPFGRGCVLGLPPLSPGVEQASLCGQNAVESDQQQWRARGLRLGGHLRRTLKERNQFQRKTRGAEEAVSPADLVKRRQPFAEGCRVLLPGAVGSGPQ